MTTATSIARARRLPLALPRLNAPGLMTGIVYLLFFGYGFLSFTDPDYWWHFRTGQLIVQQQAIPYRDVFSFTISGHRWITESWLSEVCIYLSVSRLGYPFTLGCFSAVSLASFGLMQRRLLRMGAAPLVTLMLIVLAMTMSATYWTVRPQLLTWCLLAICINALLDSSKPPWLLVPVMTLWANLHAGFIFGLITVVLWFGARVWDAKSDGMPFEWRNAALFVAGCWGATLLNPNGYQLLLHRIAFLPFAGGSRDLNSISEWASPNFHAAVHLPLLIGIVLLIGLSIRGQVRDRFAALLAMTFTVLALSSSRYQPMFAIAFLPVAGLAARDLQLPKLFTESRTRSLTNWAILGMIAVTLAAVLPTLPNAQIDRQARSDSWIYYPDDALAWVQQNRPDANVFSNYGWGGYFVNGLYPRGHVFIDGRSATYGATIIDEYNSIIDANYQWQQLLEGSGTNVVVVRPNTRLASALQTTDKWQKAFASRNDVVFVRR